MEADAKRQEQRARWRENKRRQRARNAPTMPPEPAHAIVASVMKERDHRAWGKHEIPWWDDEAYLPYRPGSNIQREGLDFTADVWVACTLIEIQFGGGKPSIGKIAKWLTEKRRARSYTPGSLRIMIARAMKRIEILEATELDGRAVKRGPVWPIFNPQD